MIREKKSDYVVFVGIVVGVVKMTVRKASIPFWKKESGERLGGG